MRVLTTFSTSFQSFPCCITPKVVADVYHLGIGGAIHRSIFPMLSRFLRVHHLYLIHWASLTRGVDLPPTQTSKRYNKYIKEKAFIGFIRSFSSNISTKIIFLLSSVCPHSPSLPQIFPSGLKHFHFRSTISQKSSTIFN